MREIYLSHFTAECWNLLIVILKATCEVYYLFVSQFLLLLIFKVKMPEATSVTLRWAKLSEHASAPTRGSEKAAGYDLRSAYDCTVPARGKEMVATDIQVALPSGCYGRIAPRSGLAAKNSIDVGGKLQTLGKIFEES